ncbi:uncharacterized protein MICPUCDRAFT_57269 [Micromonas pusilla CCMP1545]|uniref:Predicted protein n=1 Tax=Micromonas pusilla (strain CCMP1545) TaxID=564608 RepID=C1MQF2_MICPC|nr:uncharacterized protein MICPUCDRAFT_57269 [Micromonas pusilla CCMP1545]EEH57697.1 predicted protein [Micromonas pusilla CCMP1545]|eukprot:XP_003057746.1 predicted protein [Micromonas pusilla CCMP1545]
MFFHIEQEKNIVLEPMYFGKRMREMIESRVRQEVEGSCTGRHGYIVMVTNIVHISEGMITDDGTARAKFHVKYSAIAFRPFKNEVLDCVVVQVTKFGFFAEAGPLKLFVSNQLVPEEMVFESVDENAYVDKTDISHRIVKDIEVRVKVVGLRIDHNEIFCVATMKEPYLGPSPA